MKLRSSSALTLVVWCGISLLVSLAAAETLSDNANHGKQADRPASHDAGSLPRSDERPRTGGMLELAAQDGSTPSRAGEIIQLPSPAKRGGKPLMQALGERRTIRELKPEPLTRQELADLLWAAFGVNRPEEGRRTAPSAMNSQEVDIYVALPEGLFLYEASQNQLTLKLKTDLRVRTGQTFSKDASLVLIYVAELSRLVKAKPDTRSYYAAFDAGCISQNVYLYCASEGLATVVHDLNREPLAAAMKLGSEQQIIMAQAVGRK